MKNIITVLYPPITTYPSIANILSLMWNKRERIQPWFSDHFIQLVVRPNHYDTYGDFYDHADLDNYFRIIYGLPGLGWMRVNYDSANFEVFSDYIEHQINNGYCLEACLDRYYFKFSNSYQTHHFIHSSFIYGYDNEKREVYVADFWDGGKYNTITLSYDEINASMNNNGIINLFKSHDDKYKFKPELMKIYLYDYLNCTDSFLKFRFSNKEYNQNVIFGIEFYEFLLCNISKRERVDVRLSHILYDHKILMKLRLEYLTKHHEYNTQKLYELSIQNDGLIKNSLMLRNWIIRYTLKNDDKLLNRICNKIVEIKKEDIDFINQFLDII